MSTRRIAYNSEHGVSGVAWKHYHYGILLYIYLVEYLGDLVSNLVICACYHDVYIIDSCYI